MGILIWLIVGLIAGLIARAVVPGSDSMGLLGTLVLGLIGSLVGGFLGDLELGDGVPNRHRDELRASLVEHGVRQRHCEDLVRTTRRVCSRTRGWWWCRRSC